METGRFYLRGPLNHTWEWLENYVWERRSKSMFADNDRRRKNFIEFWPFNKQVTLTQKASSLTLLHSCLKLFCINLGMILWSSMEISIGQGSKEIWPSNKLKTNLIIHVFIDLWYHTPNQTHRKYTLEDVWYNPVSAKGASSGSLS